MKKHQLMALSLMCTMAAAVLFQPALMGRPRVRAVPTPAEFDREPQFEFGQPTRNTVEEPVGEIVDR